MRGFCLRAAHYRIAGKLVEDLVRFRARVAKEYAVAE